MMLRGILLSAFVVLLATLWMGCQGDRRRGGEDGHGFPGDASTSADGGASTPVPDGGVTTPVPDGGVSTPVPDGGASTPVPDGGASPTCATGPEADPLTCSDGCSNDGDAFIDCEDYDCCGVVACPSASACGMMTTSGDHVSRSAADCVGRGTVSYAFSSTRYDVSTIALSTTSGYQIFGYTRDHIASGPFPLTGMTDERQVRAADLGSGLQVALSRWGGSSWTGSDGGSASYSDDSTIHLATDADALYATYGCVGYLEGTATAGVAGGVDYMVFDFVAPILGLGFPGLR